MPGYLCEELILEIFTRLPSKSLLRFRSLSKSLCSCIGSPSFIRMHTSRSPQKVLITHFVDNIKKYGNGYFYTSHSEDQLPLCTRRGYIGISAVELPYNSLSVIVGSCNGIICLLEYRNGKNNIRLWNPSIKGELTLLVHLGRACPCCPEIRYSGVHRTQVGLGIAATALGFGFDKITDDYKIVSIPIYGGIRACSFIYTKKTGAWCEITSPTPLFYKVTSRGCFADGALHWVVEPLHTGSYGGVAHFYILTFNLSTHVFGKIVLPDSFWKIEPLATFQGSLAVISKKDDHIWIRVMRSWSVVFKLKTNRLQGPSRRVLGLTNNGDVLFETYHKRFEVYDSKNGARSRLLNLNVESRISDVQMFVESLQLLDVGTTCRGIQN